MKREGQCEKRDEVQLMSRSPSDPLLGMLLLLEDEFRNEPGVRVRPLAPTRFQRSPDLPQDYDPESAQLHRIQGIRVFTSVREYFFPIDWFDERPRRQLDAQVAQIREQLSRES
ncbi:MAG: hypothetical protein RJB38_1519 [Pseudomonadota bacterium]|jgi:hypothetical protein